MADIADEAGLRAASARFYEAVNAVCDGNPAPMLRIWSHEQDVSYCDPRGEVRRGWDLLEGYWKDAAAANAYADVKITAVAELRQVVVVGNLGYFIAGEQVRRDGDSDVLETRATVIFRYENGEWRVVHRHADAPPLIVTTAEPSTTSEDAAGTEGAGAGAASAAMAGESGEGEAASG